MWMSDRKELSTIYKVQAEGANRPLEFERDGAMEEEEVFERNAENLGTLKQRHKYGGIKGEQVRTVSDDFFFFIKVY